jgi:CheY-like chemotaxis protein
MYHGIVRAFKKAKIANPVSLAHDGIDALEMLRGTNGRERFPRPFLILLDLNMPRMNGIEFLKELRQDDELRKSIVFVMTTFGGWSNFPLGDLLSDPVCRLSCQVGHRKP